MRKFLALLLATVVCCGTLVGCGKEKDSSEKNKEGKVFKEGTGLPLNVTVDAAASSLKMFDDGKTIIFDFFEKHEKNQTIFEQNSSAIISLIGNDDGKIVCAKLCCEDEKAFRNMVALLSIALDISVDEMKICYEKTGMNNLTEMGDSVDDAKIYVAGGLRYQVTHLKGFYDFRVERDIETSNEYVEKE